MRLVVLGAGGFGRTVADIASQLGYEVTFLDDSIPDFELLSFAKFISDDVEFIPAFGNNEFRMKWIEQIKEAGGKVATLIHPASYVSPTANVKEGTVVLPKAVINTESIVEKGCIINVGAMIDHGCVIEEGCHICLGAIIKAENRVKKMTKIEAGIVIEARQWKV